MIGLGLSVALSLPAAADVALSRVLSSNSNLSPEYRSLIRPPVPGALVGQPRRPSRLREDDLSGMPRFSGSNSQFEQLARSAARRNSIPEDLFLRLVRAESGFRPTAKSSKGAIGLAQLMPQTARLLRVDPHDPQQNLDGGARYLAQQYARFGSWRLALAAYNAGPAAVERHSGVPPYRETQAYVKTILGR